MKEREAEKRVRQIATKWFEANVATLGDLPMLQLSQHSKFLEFADQQIASFHTYQPIGGQHHSVRQWLNHEFFQWKLTR